MRFKLAGIALAAAAALGVIAAPTPALAGVNDCPVGYFCIWTGYDYTSTRYQWNRSTIDAGTRHGIRLGTLATNRGRSFFNRTTTSVNIYDDGACGYNPWTRTMVSGQYQSDSAADWDNRVSSIQIAAYAPNC